MADDYQNEIKQHEAIIDGATDSVSVDGTSTRFNIRQARKRLAELRAKDGSSLAAGQFRPRVAKLRIGGAW